VIDGGLCGFGLCGEEAVLPARDLETGSRHREVPGFVAAPLACFRFQGIPADLKGCMKKREGGRRAGDGLDGSRLDAIVAKAHKEVDTRMRGYREQSLRLHPKVCARCGRGFDNTNLHELTVHHKDHNHDNNPPDGSNWENLCLYCHDWEHQKYSYAIKGGNAGFGLTNANTHNAEVVPEVTHSPFAGLKDVLAKKQQK